MNVTIIMETSESQHLRANATRGDLFWGREGLGAGLSLLSCHVIVSAAEMQFKFWPKVSYPEYAKNTLHL